MDVSTILDELNSEQREAVAAPIGNLLVLAGAGSGKTRVLVHRVAWYIQTAVAVPFGILAVTFTNKAAAEMRARIESLLKRPIGGMWVGTFHGIAHRLLRLHWQEAGLPQSFQILDSEDQLRAIRRVIRALELDESRFPPKESQWFINARKDEGLRPQHVDDQGDPTLHTMRKIYQTYQDTCDRAGLVDFAELLLRSHELFRDQQALRSHYQQRFRHILVDEFQDTNALQYAWLRLLVGGSSALFAVGDDDQSIYSWRGARMENMMRFEKDFPATQLLRLQQNYRSTANILKAANSLIANNSGRLGKDLWTSSDDGEKIRVYAAYNEYDEARYIIDCINGVVEVGGRYRDHAVMYRISAQSRVLEEVLMQAGIPYRVYGGTRFYERAEIKDALAYVRLAAFHDDDSSFERIVNMPTRGVGQRTMAHLRNLARQDQSSMWQAATVSVEQKLLSARALGSLQAFLHLIHSMSSGINTLPLDEVVDSCIRQSGLLEHFRKDKGEKSVARIENLEELIGAAREFKGNNRENEELSPLLAFLTHAALESGDTQADAHTDCVQLMTLHSAKGLEFKNVYLVGMEEGLFPHQHSSQDLLKLEEERRLCYVGMTRAKSAVTLTYTQHRRLHGAEFHPQPSRFLQELPGDLVDEVRIGGNSNRAIVARPVLDGGTDWPFVLGARVRHMKFGEGVVLNLEGQGSHARVQVNFESVGSKWLVLAYAGLEAA